MEQTVLYLGLDPPEKWCGAAVLHYPVIRIAPREPGEESIRIAMESLHTFTHYVFTSQSAVRIFFDYLPLYGYGVEHLLGSGIAVGAATAACLQRYGVRIAAVAEEERAEGIAKTISSLGLKNPYFLWPRSAKARTVLTEFWTFRGMRYCDVILYDTELYHQGIPPSLDTIQEIVFTSPSTVDGFLKTWGALPDNKKLTAIGPITEEALKRSRLCR